MGAGHYEASQFGAPAIDTEHLLLGLLREEQSILSRFFPAPASVDSIRKQIERRMLFRQQVPTSVELPLSVETKNVLRYAAEEADSLSHREIKPEHFLLGMFREQDSLGAQVLRENGVEYAIVRKELEKEVEG
jgi:ATP-dependent Clp protease ATP-binding subunit ClpC